MNESDTMHLDAGQLAKLSSAYLAGGRRSERWQIDEATVTAEGLEASVSVPEIYLPPEAGNAFHLSVFTALEFVSQLQIVYMHVWAGLSEKTQEVWMTESRMKSGRAIFDREAIRVSLRVERIRRRGAAVICTAHHEVTDRHGGSMTFWIKAYMG
jgi:hypothetical protein